jgi:hypothetical protein
MALPFQRRHSHNTVRHPVPHYQIFHRGGHRTSLLIVVLTEIALAACHYWLACRQGPYKRQCQDDHGSATSPSKALSSGDN